MNKGKQIESEQPPPNHQTELIFSLIFFCWISRYRDTSRLR
jgi:hypothetical protein